MKFIRWRRLLTIMSFTATVFVAGACLEELNNLDEIGGAVTPAIEFPLVNSDFTLEEFLLEGETLGLVSDENGVIVITYKDTLVTPRAETFFNVPDQQSPTVSFNGPDVVFPGPGFSFTFTDSRTFTINSTEQLDSILFKSGQMVFNIQSDMPTNINLTVAIQSLQGAGGNVFSQNFVLNGPASINPSFDLQGSSLDLTDGGTTNNTIAFSITAVVTNNGAALSGTSFSFNFELNNLLFRGLFGQLTSRNYQTPVNTLDIDVFNNMDQGSFSLVNPMISLDVANSFGLPLTFDISQFTAIQKNGNVIPLSGPAASAPLNPYLIAAPTITQLGQVAVSNISVTGANSNIDQMLSALPDNLVYTFSGQLNPGGATNNFVLDESRMVIGVDVALPLHGTLSGLEMSKQFDFDGLGIDDVLESKVVVKTVNEFPLDVFIQAYFLNGSGGIIDSLFVDNENFLKAASVDANGFTQAPVESIKTVVLDQAKADRIDQATFLLLTATLGTTNNGTVPVKLAIDDRLRVSIGVNAKVEYKVN